MTPPNQFYPGNRKPLAPGLLIKLPTSSIRPAGWLRRQLEFMAEGLAGKLPELSKWCRFEGSAWANLMGQGEWGWEELPYWLRGFTELGYALQDQRLIAEGRKWVDALIAGQRAGGYFGPEANRKTPDVWPNMVALYALRSHHEATGDLRVLGLMTSYFRWLLTVPRDKFLPGDWQKWRGGDNLDSLYWLYNRTGEAWLLSLARLNHERTADWTAGIPTWHGVNLAQGFREPAQYYRQSHDPLHLLASLCNYELVINKYGQAPGGMYGADENAREGYYGPRQGAESCAMAELMWSHELLLGLTGERVWADRCEEIAFNSLPCAMTPDLKGLHYLTCPNQVQLDGTNKAPAIENEGDMFSYDPHRYRCCQHNLGFAWPYFAAHLWMATAGDGLAATLYAPGTVTAKVGNGTQVRLTETTDYPFDETVVIGISTPQKVNFPLRLRVPGWCAKPAVQLNGKPLPAPDAGAAWITLQRTWKDGDEVRLQLPMELVARVWEKNRGTVSLYRGPLAYSLKIGERWVRYGDDEKWPAFEVFPTSAWNYGLLLDPKNPASSITVVKRVGPLPDQPFALDAAPVSLRARARRIPAWQLEANGLLQEVRASPVQSSEPDEEVLLIPMGCARLRITAFPRIGAGPEASEWR